MDSVQQALQAEAQRRGMMGAPSSAGIGAQQANSPMGGNPMAQNGTMPLSQEMYKGATQMQSKAQPSESNIILKALIARLKQHPVQQQ
jgi:hypothetical protein